jgi:RimJ/RimL family protein N-acetyltransferase
MTSAATNRAASVPELSMRPLRLPADVAIVHEWVSKEYARYWGMLGLTREGVESAYRAILEPAHVRAYLGHYYDRPAFLAETYRPLEDPLREHYDARPGDRGMHMLVAPPTRRIEGFTFGVFCAVMDSLFADPSCERVVVEPDVRNEKIHALNLRAGFFIEKAIELAPTGTQPGKIALLSFCTRESYAAARRAEATK